MFTLFGQISLSEASDHFIQKLVEEVLPEKGFQVKNIGIFTGILNVTYDLNGDFYRFSSFFFSCLIKAGYLYT